MNIKTKNIIALLVDVVLVAMISASCIMLFNGSNGVPKSGNIEFLKYFTVLSNIMMGFAALIMIPVDILILAHKKEKCPLWAKSFMHVSATGVALTMLTVFFFLGPSMGFDIMFVQANLFMHLLSPIVAIIRVIFFEHEEERLPFYATFFGVIPLSIYGAFYLINIIVHNGYGTAQYDWYGFGASGLGLGIVSYVVVSLSVYLISFLLYFGQKKMLALYKKTSK